MTYYELIMNSELYLYIMCVLMYIYLYYILYMRLSSIITKMILYCTTLDSFTFNFAQRLCVFGGCKFQEQLDSTMSEKQHAFEMQLPDSKGSSASLAKTQLRRFHVSISGCYM